MAPAIALANYETTLPLPTKKLVNSTTNGTTNGTNGIKLERPALVSGTEVVELPLKQDANELVVRSRSQYASYIDKDLTDLDIVTLLSVAWITTVRCFTPATQIYVESHPWTSVCQISNTFQPGSCCVSALDLSPEQRLKDLVRNVRLIRSGGSSVEQSTENTPPDTGRKFLTSAIRYGGDCLSVPDPVTSAVSNDSGTKILLDITKQNDKLHAKLVFTPEAISKDLGASLLHTFDQALSMVPWLPMKPLEKLELCSEHDKQIIQGFTKNIATVNESLLHEMALEHARLTPDAPAIQSWDGNYTYRELDIITSKVASYLAKRGVGPETFVLSCFEKSKWPIVARLAVLKAGGAYISIDATDPPNFLKSVVDRVNAKIMLVSPGYEKKFASVIENVIPITDAIDESASLTTPICSSVKPNNACLILFTSGSTGQPKGIIQEHRTFATAIRDYVKALGMGRHSRVLQFDDYAFDISNNDYLASLTAGGCCCVPTPSKEISALVENINTLKANTTFLTPTFAIWIDPHLVPTLELVCIGGEPLSNELLEQWRGHVKLVNQYGMGEAATFCALNQNPKPGENAIVGYPGSGAIWLTDPSSPDILVPVGAVGEIIIEGPHLSRGYLDDVSLKADVGFLKTAPAWIKDLHPSRTSSRFYRSGDLGRYRHDGSIEHMGRKDTIIKINGCRVESTEVEYVLRKQVPTDHQVLVDLLGAIDGIKDPQIVAFLYLADNPMNLVRSAPDETMTFTAISERHVFRKTVQEMETNTGSILPKHMVPTLFILIDKIPRTRSNKTDRRKLRFLAQKWYSSQYLQ